jgi:hypothetical protein
MTRIKSKRKLSGNLWLERLDLAGTDPKGHSGLEATAAGTVLEPDTNRRSSPAVGRLPGLAASSWPTPSAEARATASKVLERFLAGYWMLRTRANYRFTLTRWLDWCHQHRLDPVGGVDAAALEAFIAGLKTAGYAPNTTVGRVSALSAFSRWCVREQVVARNPVELIRRPSRPTESANASLTRQQLTDGLAAAELPRWRVVGGDAARTERPAVRRAGRLERRGPRQPFVASHPEADHHQGSPSLRQ